ncbi:HoxN/HupN/NixA family nickel/cobalt transporter [Pseudomonas chlororaphis subsp. aureofaciens]|nr:HoxN/HupN/NixA family nickel/cobalt transporter [Pseudomonas chlororaphis]AZD86932.1 HoxN/HupN/NixA family nickel/cobalt transporter [Pseudomonas chlororaphis subsp. aureofaciens]
MTMIVHLLDKTEASNTVRRAALLLTALLVANVLAWIWAFVEFDGRPVLMGTALLAYSFGLRHAVDADHIAAIDNVTRKLMQEGKKPIAVGTYFSLGHSTIVILASAAIAATAMAFKNDVSWIQETGGLIGTFVSSVFLLLFGLLNLVILLSVYKKFKRIKAGGNIASEELDNLVTNKGGVMARLFGRMFNLVSKSWHMYPVGFLFGLGFDTATEVGVLGISAYSATQDLSLWAIMIFPILFAAGMALVDSVDNFVMIGAYGWALSKPVRKLYYNITITAASVVVALFIGGVEALGLIAEKLELKDGVWGTINKISESFGALGYWIIGLFVLCWLISVVNYYVRGYDQLDYDARKSSV